MAIAPQKVSVIGCGWLGLPLAVELIKKKFLVKGSTTRVEKLEQLKEASIQPYHLKLSEELHIDDEGLFDCDVAVINIPPGRGDDSVIASYRHKLSLIIDALKANEIGKIVFISSTGVYQNNYKEVDESAVCRPEKSSGQAVLAGEKVVQQSGIPYTILRMAGLVGGSRQPGNWFKGKKDVPGGDTPVNMVHQEDCIRAIIQVIESSKHEDDIYNICADDHPIKKDFYAHQSKAIGVKSPSFLSAILPHKIVSNQKFKDDFSYTYSYPNPNFFE